MKRFAIILAVEQYSDGDITSLKYANTVGVVMEILFRELCQFDEVRILSTDPSSDGIPDKATLGVCRTTKCETLLLLNAL